MSVGILPLCWGLGLALPIVMRSQAAGLEQLQCAVVQHSGLCDCSGFLT